MITEKLTQFAEAVSVRLYVKRPAPMEQDWRLDNWVFPCFVAIPAQESETVQETSGRVERREFELMALRSVDVTFDTSEADASTEIARTEVLDFAQQMRGVFHVEHLGGRQIWDSANGELIVGWSLRLRLTELVGESACGGEPEPAEIEITENGTYNVLPFGRAVVDVQGGTPAVVEPLEVTPDTEQHTFNPPAGVDGFAPVVVGACPVCPAPDVRPLSVVPSRDSQTFSPIGFDGFAPVEVQGYTPNLQAKTAEPATTAQVVTADEGYDGLSSVTVDAVTADIDANIVAGNIKKDVQILGVTGTMEPMPNGDELTFDFDGNGEQTFVSASEFDGALDANALYSTVALVGVVMRKCVQILGSAFNKSDKLRFVVMPSCADVRGQALLNCPLLEMLVVGTLTGVGSTWIGSAAAYDKNKLRNVVVGAGTAISLPLSRWTATDVIAEGQSGIDELNYNIKTYIADKVADRTNDTALTITFGASLYNVLTAETIAAFTAKNWNVASA